MANRVCASLEARNISCWIAPRDISVGQEWPTAIVGGIQDSRALILLLSSNSKNARQIAREAELADNHGLKIVTLRLEDVQPPPELLYFIGNIQWIDAFGPRFDEAIACVADVIQKSAPVAASTAPADQPRPAETSPLISIKPAYVPRAPITPASASKSAPHSFPKWIYAALAALIIVGIILWALTRGHSPAPSPHDYSNAQGGGSADTKARAFDEYKRGKQLADSGQTAEALKAYANAMQIDPTLPNSYYGRAVIYHEQKELPEALKDVGSAIQYSPNYVLAHELRGSIYNDLGQYKDAISDFTFVINQTNGARTFDYRGRAKAYRAVGDAPAAAQDEAAANSLGGRPARKK